MTAMLDSRFLGSSMPKYYVVTCLGMNICVVDSSSGPFLAGLPSW